MPNTKIPALPERTGIQCLADYTAAETRAYGKSCYEAGRLAGLAERQHAAGAAQPQDEREAFEAAYTLKLLTMKDAQRAFRRLSHTPDEYEVASVHAAWVMWQYARAALQQPAPEAAKGAETVAQQYAREELARQMAPVYEAFAATPPAPEAQQADLPTLCAEVAKRLGSGWLVIGPDGSRFQGPTPHRAANAASKHHSRMVYDPVKAAEFAAVVAETQRKSAEENERLLEVFGSLDCPACGGSGHVGDTRPEPPQPVAGGVPNDAEFRRGWDACMAVWADHMKRMNDAINKPLTSGYANHAAELGARMLLLRDTAPQPTTHPAQASQEPKP